MDWLSKRKFVIVCLEKVVRILLKGDEILWVHGERTKGVVKSLMSTKVDESKLSDISVVRDFIDVFSEETTDKVVLVKENPKAVRDHQKSYVDYGCKPLEFEVGDRVWLKVTPWKGVVHFGKKGKLAPRYVGPFKILERIELVAYRFRLPEELNSVHDTCHVSNLKRCLADANLHVPLDEIKVNKTLHFVKEPVKIMD
nr:putative reverse transcriptase domain-containing protein [Tanacetum cinerariifolium]